MGQNMRERKVFGLLILLDGGEMELFAAYLGSALFEQGEVLQRFLACWQSHFFSGAPSAQDPSVEQLLQGSGLVPARFDKYCSALHKRLLDFLAWRAYMQDELPQLQSGLRALVARQAPRKEIEAMRSKLAGQIKEMPQSSERLRLEMDFHWKEAEDRVQSRATQNVWQENFHQLHLATERYFVLQKLKLECAAANARLIFNQAIEPPAPGQLFVLPEMGREEAAAQLDALSLSYWIILQMYRSASGDAEFLWLFSHLQASASGFEDQERKELYTYLLNYCLRRGNQGELQFQRHSAAIYRELLDNGVVLNHGKLAPQVMKNIVVIHCVVGELDWVEAFLEAFKERLDGEPDPNIIKYNQAVLAFYRHERKAIDLFREVISQLKGDIFYELDSRTYLLKAFYEHLGILSAEELDEMYKIFDSFRIFLDRNQVISSQHKQRYRSFLLELRRFLKILEAAPHPSGKVRLRQMQHRIQAAAFIANKGWLLQKISEQIQA
jgi:hypothetical protein